MAETSEIVKTKREGVPIDRDMDQVLLSIELNENTEGITTFLRYGASVNTLRRIFTSPEASLALPDVGVVDICDGQITNPNGKDLFIMGSAIAFKILRSKDLQVWKMHYIPPLPEPHSANGIGSREELIEYYTPKLEGEEQDISAELKVENPVTSANIHLRKYREKTIQELKYLKSLFEDGTISRPYNIIVSPTKELEAWLLLKDIIVSRSEVEGEVTLYSIDFDKLVSNFL